MSVEKSIKSNLDQFVVLFCEVPLNEARDDDKTQNLMFTTVESPPPRASNPLSNHTRPKEVWIFCEDMENMQ